MPSKFVLFQICFSSSTKNKFKNIYQIIQSFASIKYPRQPNFTPSTVPLRMCGTLQIRHASHNNCTKSHRVAGTISSSGPFAAQAHTHFTPTQCCMSLVAQTLVTRATVLVFVRISCVHRKLFSSYN